VLVEPDACDLSWYCDMADKSDDNSKLAYDYTESTLKSVTESYDSVTTKLSSALVFSGVLLKFATDLSNKDYLLTAKVLICACLIIAMGMCGIGLWPRSTGSNLVNPDDFLESGGNNMYGFSEEQCRIYIARAWNKEIKAILRNRGIRVRYLTIAIIFLALAALGFGISILQSGFTSESKL
jgi:hypothetical protein